MKMNIRRALKQLLRRKKLLILIAASLVLTAAAGTTVAWLSAKSEDLSNTFTVAEVTCEITETFDGEEKSDVGVTNTGTMDAYIRAVLIPVWLDGDTIAGIPASLSDLTIDWGDGYGTEWVLGNDGYYYCTAPIPAGAATPILIDACTVRADGDYRLELQISAQAVQALPAIAVTGIWDAVTAVQADGTLEVAS